MVRYFGCVVVIACLFCFHPDETVVASDTLVLVCGVDTAERNYTTPEDKTSRDVEPSYNPDDVTTREVVELSKLPDAHQPSDEEIPAIERADWPAPPHPAAAYPELCMCLTHRCISYFAD